MCRNHTHVDEVSYVLLPELLLNEEQLSDFYKLVRTLIVTNMSFKVSVWQAPPHLDFPCCLNSPLLGTALFSH